MANLPLDLLTLAAWSRFAPLRERALHRLQPSTPAFTSAGAASILFGGDVMLDPVIRKPGHLRSLGLRRVHHGTRRHTAAGRIGGHLWRHLAEPLLSREYYSRAALGEFTDYEEGPPAWSKAVPMDAEGRRTDLDWATVASDFDYPFRRLRQFFEARDLVVLNLESPLTHHARMQGMFRGDPCYAPAMRSAGVSVVNLSNNHLFDGGEVGFLDTLRVLKDAGIPYIGVGDTVRDARAGTLVEVRGTRVLFLCYTQFCNSRFASVADSYPGVLPLAPQLMVEDVRAGAGRSDLVIVSVHWGHENQPAVHPRQVEIAHDLIEAGAGAVIGHHPHVPHAIEVYRRRPIVYSLGNLVFAQALNHPRWGDNFMAELAIEDRRVSGVIVHPVSGRGPALFQPEPLRGAAARGLLRRVQLLSAPFRTRIAVSGDAGYIAVND